MELLASNFQPLNTEHTKFNVRFDQLFAEADKVDIAVGYISEQSVKKLANDILNNDGPFCNLIIGMHYFDKFTKGQYAAVKDVERFFNTYKFGNIKLVNSFPFHGKIYSFQKQNQRTAIIGSSNMSNIIKHQSVRQYEFDIFIDDAQTNRAISKFMTNLFDISPNIGDIEIDPKSFNETNKFLIEDRLVTKVDNILKYKNNIIEDKKLDLPIKIREKSNINLCFGQGRKNSATGKIIPRSWYEVEIIVDKRFTDKPWYPSGKIMVITDDGYQFECSVQGDNKKNFRSVGDLRILGKWLKGRLEASGVIKVGERVTDEALESYGRRSVMLAPTSIDKIWYMDFSAVEIRK